MCIEYILKKKIYIYFLNIISAFINVVWLCLISIIVIITTICFLCQHKFEKLLSVMHTMFAVVVRHSSA